MSIAIRIRNQISRRRFRSCMWQTSIILLFFASEGFSTASHRVWAASATGQNERPNVILIVTDDQGYGDMSCHGNPWLRTPHLDRLSAEGVRLTDYHVDPVCTPTRAALMTGRYSSRVGAWSVTEGRQLLDPDEITMGDVFRNSGYRTGMFGKWHLGDPWPYAPRFRGFQTVVRHMAGGVDEIGNPYDNDFFDDTYYRNGIPERFTGYCTDVFFDECIDFVSQSSSQPFFVYLPLNAMHGPHHVDAKYSSRFFELGMPENRAKFYGMIENFDENLGRLLAVINQRELADNTIIIFMGDNGTAAGFSQQGEHRSGFNAGMRGKKGSVYDGGHRVACFARWPGRFPAAHDVTELTMHCDWMPTLIELCRLRTPQKVHFDGRSIAAWLTGDKPQDWPDREVIVERQADQPKLNPAGGGRDRYPHYAVLTSRWRLVDGALFDMQSDPAQTRNIAPSQAQVVARLSQAYRSYFHDVYTNRDYTRFQIGMDAENPTRFTVRDWHPTHGNVIWKQSQLGDDDLFINGFWAINVQAAGDYEFRLARFPDDAPAPMKATSARIELSGTELVKSIDPADASVTFSVQLDAGPTVLQTWLTDERTGRERGAYFIHVRRLDPPRQPLIDDGFKSDERSKSGD